MLSCPISYYVFYTDYTSAGNYVITLDVTDNFGADNSLNYTWNVEVVDVDQEIVVDDLAYASYDVAWYTDDQQINETDELNFLIDAYDPDGNTLLYSWKLDGTSVSTVSYYDYI